MAKLSARGRVELARLTKTFEREDEQGKYEVVYHRVYMSDGKILTKTTLSGNRYKSGYVVNGSYPLPKLAEIVSQRKEDGWVVVNFTDPLLTMVD